MDPSPPLNKYIVRAHRDQPSLWENDKRNCTLQRRDTAPRKPVTPRPSSENLKRRTGNVFQVEKSKR